MKKTLLIGISAIAVVALVIIGAIFLFAQQNPITRTVIITLDVRPAPDFTVLASTSSIVSPINRIITFTVGATSVNDFAGEVVVTVSGEPVGSMVTFLPSNTFTLGAGETRGVQIDIALPDDPGIVGLHTITVTAESTNYN